MSNWLDKIWPFGRKQLPNTPYWQAYQEALAQQPAKDSPIQDIRFVVLDTETTGLDPHKDHILSIGAVAVRKQKIWVADRFEAFLPQKQLIKNLDEAEAVAVHGILSKHANQQQETADILIEFLNYLGGSVFVAHHAAFDFGILQNAFQRYLNGSLSNPTLDTVHLAKRLDDPMGRKMMGPKEAKQYSLDQLCRRFNIPIEARHTASGDALLTAILLVKLLARLEARGVKRWGELWR